MYDAIAVSAALVCLVLALLFRWTPVARLRPLGPWLAVFAAICLLAAWRS